MAAGATQLAILDGAAVSRNMEVWSSTGAVTGNLSPLQGILGVDGVGIATAGNGFPVTIENASLAVTAASLPLPTGASTAAKQPALGTAGTASSDVLTIQGIASMTALKVDGSAVTQPISAASLPLPTGAATAANITAAFGTASMFSAIGGAAAPTNVLSVGGQYNSSPLTLTNTQVAGLQLDVNGYLKVDVAAGTNANGQAVMTSSAPVVIASNQSAVPVAGGTASGVSLTASPVTLGGRAATANPTAVTDGQVVNTMHDKLGKLVAVGAVRTLKGVQDTTITASTSETTIVTAVASTFNDLYGLILANSSATATNVTIKDSTAGTTRAVIYVPAGDTRGFMLPVDSAIPQATVNTAWTATSSASITSLFVTALFVQNT